MDRTARVLLLGAEDEENLAIRSLSAFLTRSGAAARVAAFSRPADTESVLEQVRAFAPDIVAASAAFQCKAAAFFDLLRRLREQGFHGHIVLGGHFPTFEYRRILDTQPAVDSVLRYEGEHGIAQLAAAVTDGVDLSAVPNLAYRKDGQIAENPCTHEFMDLDALPLPQRAAKAQVRLGERFATLISSRGCWHSSCVYCCIGAFHRQKRDKFSLRSAAGVAAEIAMLRRRMGVRLFQFHDDNFVLDSPQRTCGRIRDIRRELESLGVKYGELAFLIKARPDVVDESVAAALDEMGCVGVFLGVENATASGLRALCRGVDLAGVERAVGLLTARSISVTYNLLVFHPHATMDEIRENLNFVRAHPELPFDFGRAEIVAGSPLERMTIAEGTRCGQWPTWDYQLADPDVQRAFDINRDTFRAPGSAYSALMHELIALRYHAAVVQRLHAGPSAEALSAAVVQLIAHANEFIVERIEEMLSIAEGGPGKAEEAAACLGRALEDRCGEFTRQADAIKQEMLRLQAAEHVFERFGIREMVQKLSLAGMFGVRKGTKTRTG